MASFNKVILLGNLTRDPELRYLPSNTPVCEFGLAVNHRWRDREGNQREEVCFVDVSAFGRSGETINQYMSKGRPILIEGRLKLDTWTSKDGSKRSRHGVIVENFTFVGSRGDGGGRGGNDGGGRNDNYGGGGRNENYGGGAHQGGSAHDGGGYDAPPSGDDIPF